MGSQIAFQRGVKNFCKPKGSGDILNLERVPTFKIFKTCIAPTRISDSAFSELNRKLPRDNARNLSILKACLIVYRPEKALAPDFAFGS